MKQRRKLTSSIVLMVVAAIVLASGTYAWFVAGGLANMFTLDNNVMEAGSGIEIQGSNGKACSSETADAVEGWGSYLKEDCFNQNELISLSAGAKAYSPVSFVNGGSNAKFVKVSLKNNEFSASEATKGQNYNDFSIKLRNSSTDGIVDVAMKVKISSTPANGAGDPANAGRVAVTIGNTTTVYALNDTTDSYVKNEFTGTIIDVDDNRIITNNDTNSGVAGLTTGSVMKLDADGGNGIIIKDVNYSEPKTIYVQTWIEGNDPDCIDATKDGTKSIENGHFVVDISFETVD